jgi:hypothetical protein
MKKPNIIKKCQNCDASVSQFWKTLTVNGVRKKVCQKCALKLEKNKIKEKKEKQKIKRKEKRERLTLVKVQILCNKMIKEIYPLHCHACYKPLEKGTIDCQACHFVSSKNYKITTFDPRNILPGCSRCNGFDDTHVYELGKNINRYWGDGTAEMLRKVSRDTYQWNQYQLQLLKDLFTNFPTGETLEETRQLILERYLEIKA